MKTIRCENRNGLSAVFTYDHDNTEYFLDTLEGVYEIKNSVNTTKNAMTDGSTYSGEALEQRNIVITANIRRNYKQNRDYLARVFQVHSKGIFYHTENGETREIEYFVESINCAEKGVLRPVIISLICPGAYFKDAEANHVEMAGWENNLEYELEIPEDGMELGVRLKETIRMVENKSAIAIGIKMTIVAEYIVVNPTIMNLTTGEKLKLLCTMLPNDKIVITTMQGNIDVVLHRGEQIFDYNHTVDEDYEDYVQLESGRNYINYTADEGEDFMNVYFDFENYYIMP